MTAASSSDRVSDECLSEILAAIGNTFIIIIICQIMKKYFELRKAQAVTTAASG